MLVQKVNIYPPGTKVILANRKRNLPTPFDTHLFAYVHSYHFINKKNAEKSSGWCKHRFRGELVPHLAVNFVCHKKDVRGKGKGAFVVPADEVTQYIKP